MSTFLFDLLMKFFVSSHFDLHLILTRSLFTAWKSLNMKIFPFFALLCYAILFCWLWILVFIRIYYFLKIYAGVFLLSSFVFFNFSFDNALSLLHWTRSNLIFVFDSFHFLERENERKCESFFISKRHIQANVLAFYSVYECILFDSLNFLC